MSETLNRLAIYDLIAVLLSKVSRSLSIYFLILSIVALITLMK